MVTLSSSTVEATVLCQKTPVSFTTELGAVGDGSTDNKAAIEEFHDVYASTSRSITLNVAAGDFENTTLAAGKGFFVGKPGNLTISGAALVGGEPATSFLKNFRVGTVDAPPTTLSQSVRLEAVTAGQTTVTVKTFDPSGDGRSLADLMALFTVGKKVLLTAYDMMGYGYPQNPGRAEFLTVASKTTNTITFTTPIAQDYPDDVPDYFGQPDDAEFPGSIGLDHGGPATLYQLPDAWAGTARVERIDFPEDEQLTFAKENVYFIDCQKTVNDIAPSVHEYCLIQGGTFAEFEVDKIIRRMDLVDVDVSGLLDVQSPAPDYMLISGSTIGNVNGTSRVTEITGSTLTAVAQLGPLSFGGAESVTITDSSFPGLGNPRSNGRLRPIGGAVISGATLTGARYSFTDVTGTVTQGETITGGTSGATGVLVVQDGVYGWLVGSITGEFQPGETVSASSLTSATISYNTFGQEWAVPDVYVMFKSDAGYFDGRRITRFHRSAGLNIVTFDRSIQEYVDDYTHVNVHNCPSLTVNGCTGGDAATAYNLATDGDPLGAYARWSMKDDGTVSQALPVLGHLVSVEISVTTAYTGARSNLYLTFGQFGYVGARLPSGAATTDNADRLNILVDLKQTGTRTVTVSGSTGFLSGETGDAGNFIFTAPNDSDTMRPIFVESAGGSAVDLSLEDPSVYPAFTVTIRANPFA